MPPEQVDELVPGSALLRDDARDSARIVCFTRPEAVPVETSESRPVNECGVSAARARDIWTVPMFFDHAAGQLVLAALLRVEILPCHWASYDRSIAIGMSLHHEAHAIVTGRAAPPDDVAESHADMNRKPRSP